MRRLLAFLLVIPAFAQNPSTPSQDEFRELAEKADQKISNVESAEKLFKRELDKIDPGIVSKTLEGATNAHKVIGNIRKNRGTAYNLVLLGDLDDGAPRELILTPATHGGAAPPPAPVTTTIDEAANGPDAEIPPPPQPEVPPAGTTPPPTPGVKTPQQLFEQLQKMRSAQQQQVTTDPSQQQQQPQQPPPQ